MEFLTIEKLKAKVSTKDNLALSLMFVCLFDVGLVCAFYPYTAVQLFKLVTQPTHQTLIDV